MKPKNWIFFLQLNAESNLIQSMLDVFDAVKKGYKTGTPFQFVILLDGPIKEHEHSGPKLYLINNKSELESPDATYTFNNLSTPENIVTILDNVFKKTESTDTTQLIYLIKDHGGGMDLLTNNKIYQHLDVVFAKEDRTISDEEVIQELKEKYKDHFPGFIIEDTFPWNKIFRILFSQERKDTTYLSIADIGQAIQTSRFKKAAVLGIDSCWGQMIENAFSVSSSCSYFIANEDQGPIAGLGYALLAKYLMSVPHEMKSEEIVNAITASYILSNQHDYLTDKAYIKMGVCLSAIKTSSLGDLLVQFNGICETLLRLLNDKEYNENIIKNIFNARIKCFDFLYDGKVPDPNGEYCVFVIDLIHFFMLLEGQIKMDFPELSNQILSFIVNLYENLKVEKNNYREYDGKTYNVIAKGISFFFPLTLLHWENSTMYLTPAELNATSLPLHKQILQKTAWPRVLAKYFSLLPPPMKEPTNNIFEKYLESNKFWDDSTDDSLYRRVKDEMYEKYPFAFNWIEDSLKSFGQNFSDNTIEFLKQIKPDNTNE